MSALRIGLVSDTHDLLRRPVVERLRGVDEIIHGGDVCNPELLAELRAIAPVRVVRGNCDRGAWSEQLPWSDTFEVGGILVHARHILAQLDLEPKAAGISLVLSGHTHEPRREEVDGVLYVNPGSAGPRRFRLPISMGFLHVEKGSVDVELIELTGA